MLSSSNSSSCHAVDTPEGPCRTADYDSDRTICGALLGAFGSRTTFSIIEKYESVAVDSVQSV